MSAFSSSITSTHPNVALIYKKLSKRDGVTRRKTLLELIDFLSNADKDESIEFTQYWFKSYYSLVLDVDPSIRLHTASANSTLVKNLEKDLAPFLKILVPCWICSMVDPANDVALISKNSFDTCFPDKKANVFYFCRQEIIDFIIDHLLKQTPASLSIFI